MRVQQMREQGLCANERDATSARATDARDVRARAVRKRARCNRREQRMSANRRDATGARETVARDDVGARYETRDGKREMQQIRGARVGDEMQKRDGSRTTDRSWRPTSKDMRKRKVVMQRRTGEGAYYRRAERRAQRVNMQQGRKEGGRNMEVDARTNKLDRSAVGKRRCANAGGGG